MPSDDLTTSPDIRCLLEYACRKYREERYPLSPELRPVREAIERLFPRPVPPPVTPPGVPSMLAQRMRKGRRR